MNTLYDVLADGATVLALSGYVAHSLKYWWVGAALLPKLGFCGWICRGFGMCAACVGLTFGLVVGQVRSFNFITVGFTLMAAGYNLIEGLICLMGTSFNLIEARIYLVDVSFNLIEAIIYLVGASF